MNTNKPLSERNPALQALESFPGDWEMELSNAAFLPDPSATVKGQVSFYYLENGAFLVMRMGEKPPQPYDAIWLISRDEATPNYQVSYYDARKVSRLYAMSFSDGIWKMWRESPGFWQRFEGRVSMDGNTVTGHWEKSIDGHAWEHDFDVKYSKLK